MSIAYLRMHPTCIKVFLLSLWKRLSGVTASRSIYSSLESLTITCFRCCRHILNICPRRKFGLWKKEGKSGINIDWELNNQFTLDWMENGHQLCVQCQSHLNKLEPRARWLTALVLLKGKISRVLEIHVIQFEMSSWITACPLYP